VVVRREHEPTRRVAADRRTVPASHAVDDKRLSDEVADPHARVQRLVGVLEDQMHPPTCAAQGSLTRPGELLSLEDNVALLRPLHAEYQPGHRRLAGAAFTDERDDLAGGDGQVEIGDRG